MGAMWQIKGRVSTAKPGKRSQPKSRATRKNFSRAATRSDWKLHPMGVAANDSAGGMEVVKGNPGEPPDSEWRMSAVGRPNLPVFRLTAAEDTQNKLEGAPHSTGRARAFDPEEREEAALVRALSPRLQLSITTRLGRTKRGRTHRKPLAGGARRYHLSKIFRGGYGRRRRDAKKTSGTRKLHPPSTEDAVGAIELFDSRNYAGGVFAGKFF